MNVHAPITELSDVNMTSKGQVLIPKAVRDRVGLVPGAAVRVGINDRGEAVVLPAQRPADETPEQRSQRRLAVMDRLAAQYGTGQSPDDYMAEIRGPYDGIL